MRIATITNWAYGITTGFTLVAGAALYLAASADLRERAAVGQRSMLDAASEKIAVDDLELSEQARMYVVTGDDLYRQRFENLIGETAEVEQRLIAVQDAGANEVELLALGDALRSAERLQDHQRKAVDLTRQGDTEAARLALFGQEYMRELDQAEAHVSRFQYLMEQRIDATVADATRATLFLRRFSEVMVGATGMMFLFVMGFILKQRILQPVVRLSDVVNRLAAQDFEVEPPKTSQIDEIGDITQAIRVFRENGLARQKLERQRDADWAVRELLARMTQRLHGCETMDDMVRIVVLFAPTIAPGLSGALYIRDETSDQMVNVAHWPVEDLPDHLLNSDECWALRRGHLHRPGGNLMDVPCRHVPPALAGAAICVPLSAQGETAGLLTFHPTSAEHPPITEAYLELMAETVGMTLANLNLRSRLQDLALLDPLTGLSNRHQLDQILQRISGEAISASEPFSCIMLDIDRFKSINDRFGHAAGDAVIRAVANAIRASIRSSDHAVRYGGEEFLLILPSLSENQAQDRAATLRERIRSLTISDQGQFLPPITVSAGVATFPQHGTASAIVHAADEALLVAKQSGRDKIVLASVA